MVEANGNDMLKVKLDERGAKHEWQVNVACCSLIQGDESNDSDDSDDESSGGAIGDESWLLHMFFFVFFFLTYFKITAFWPRDALLGETAWHQCTHCFTR